MGSELIQFGAMIGVFLIAAVAWFFVIYLPGRSMEGQWEGDRAERDALNDRRNAEESSEKEIVSV